jgi:hypothetical protein
MLSLNKTIISGLLILALSPTYASSNHETIIWTAVFSNIMPIKKNISQAYCQSHTPTVITTTIKQITNAKGIRALNGVNIRYLSYKTLHKDHLYFNVVRAIVSGKNPKHGAWSEPMKLYEQTLLPTDTTYTVWSTHHCKGTFLGTPTRIPSGKQYG